VFKLHPQLASDTIELGDLPISKVLLMNEAQFPWFILVPMRAEVKELHELSDADAKLVSQESLTIGRFMMAHFKGEKLNTAALGNLVPQLHIHHIVRFDNDAAWPKPVWGNIAAQPYDERELGTLSNSLKTLISARIPEFKPTRTPEEQDW